MLTSLVAHNGQANELNRLRWVLATCRLLWHPEWRQQPCIKQRRLRKLFLQDLSTLAGAASADQLATDQPQVRRMEGLGLRELGTMPDGRRPIRSARQALQAKCEFDPWLD